MLSPAVGPIIGGALISSNVSWRWLFWTAAGANATLQLFGIFALQETYGPWILHCKARRLRQSTGNTLLRTEVELNCQRLSHHIAKALKRPWVVLTTQPIIQALSIYSAFLYGLLYIFISSMPTVWMKIYGENQCITGLNYLSVAVGSLIGSQTCAPLNDVLYKILKKRYNYEEGCPEFRIPLMGVGAAGAPIGILIYGWSVWARLHWAVPNVRRSPLSRRSVSFILPSTHPTTYPSTQHLTRPASSSLRSPPTSPPNAPKPTSSTPTAPTHTAHPPSRPQISCAPSQRSPCHCLRRVCLGSWVLEVRVLCWLVWLLRWGYRRHCCFGGMGRV